MPGPHFIIPEPKPWKEILAWAAVVVLAFAFVGSALFFAMVA